MVLRLGRGALACSPSGTLEHGLRYTVANIQARTGVLLVVHGLHSSGAGVNACSLLPASVLHIFRVVR
jgi:hypothetical protein